MSIRTKVVRLVFVVFILSATVFVTFDVYAQSPTPEPEYDVFVYLPLTANETSSVPTTSSAMSLVTPQRQDVNQASGILGFGLVGTMALLAFVIVQALEEDEEFVTGEELAHGFSETQEV